jgi:hypothetical protein
MKLEDLKGKRIFDIDLGTGNSYNKLTDCRIAIDQRVFDRANNEDFKHWFYDLGTDEEIATQVAIWFMIDCYDKISDVEGFGGLGDEDVKILDYHQIEWQGNATEIDPKTLRWDK